MHTTASRAAWQVCVRIFWQGDRIPKLLGTAARPRGAGGGSRSRRHAGFAAMDAARWSGACRRRPVMSADVCVRGMRAS